MSVELSGNEVQGFLIDFDGVIAGDSVRRTILFAYEFINSITPVNYQFLEDYFRKVLCFSPKPSVDLLFSGLGIEKHTADFFARLKKLDENSAQIVIDEMFYQFTEYCESNGAAWKILSLASSDRLRLLKNYQPDRIYSLDGRSKADPATFSSVIKDLNIVPDKWVYIEDTPVALRTGKLAGLYTIMRQNEIYNDREYEQFRNYVDFRVKNFSEVLGLIKRIS